MFELIPVKTEEQLQSLAALSNEIWHECFPGIISGEQIDYMVARFQSYDAMQRQMASDGYQYYFIAENCTIAGYTGYVCDRENGRMFLSKLYLHSSYRGHGLASQTIDALCDVCRHEGLERIRLTVNIHNTQAIDVYLHKGFTVAFDQKADIGSGFFMDDHVMELVV